MFRCCNHADGNTVEVGMTGRDGFVGLPAALGTECSPNRAFIQVPGHGFSVKAEVVQELAKPSSKLRLLLQRAVQGMLAQTAQTAACNRVHELEERLARWLLMCQDRVQSDQLFITHEFLAMMLGTADPGHRGSRYIAQRRADRIFAPACDNPEPRGPRTCFVRMLPDHPPAICSPGVV